MMSQWVGMARHVSQARMSTYSMASGATPPSSNRSWGPKLELFFEHMIATSYGTAALIGNSGTKRTGGVWDVALLAHYKYRSSQLSTVAVSASEVCIFWADGLGPNQPVY